jgi:HEAT repeat protein
MTGSPDIHALFERTLASCSDDDDDEAWAAVRELRLLGTREVFDIAVQWLHDKDPLRRQRGADVLAQLGVRRESRHAFPSEARDALVALLARETDAEPIASAVFALGHIGDLQGVAETRRFASHDRQRVRYAAAYALGNCANDPANIAILLQLMRDAEEDVRDWATFGVGELSDADSEEIRSALVERLGDSFFDARLEAMIGLAKRGDVRGLPALLQDLRHPEGETRGALEAARYLLELEDQPEKWSGADYASALEQKFGPQAPKGTSAG